LGKLADVLISGLIDAGETFMILQVYEKCFQFFSFLFTVLERSFRFFEVYKNRRNLLEKEALWQAFLCFATIWIGTVFKT